MSLTSVYSVTTEQIAPLVPGGCDFTKVGSLYPKLYDELQFLHWPFVLESQPHNPRELKNINTQKRDVV